MTFLDALTRVYLAAPCGVVPNALWKTVAQVGSLADAALVVNWDGEGVERLGCRTADAMYVYWTRDRGAGVPAGWLDGAALALLHADYATEAVAARFEQAQAFFRLRHGLEGELEAPLPAGFGFAQVDPEREAAAVSAVICRSYDHLCPAAATVVGWTEHPTFAPALWVWVVDEAMGVPAALGIAEFDATIGEGALEWIQVVPGYRGRGVGRALVVALLRALRGLGAGFATVGGEVHPTGQPEGFYRVCGFEGDDVWWVLRNP
jgi:GNAT superfamily N-acetyltransferase